MARKSTLRVQVGAVLLNKGYISSGFNQEKSHPMMKAFKQRKYNGLHAEQHSCWGVPDYQLKGATIYVGRLRRSGGQGLARPCVICYTYLKMLGVKKMMYTLDNEGYREERII